MSKENRYLVRWRPVGFVKSRLNRESGGCEIDALKKTDFNQQPFGEGIFTRMNCEIGGFHSV